MGKSVVAFDFPGIKDFVFGTDKVREIRGGSAALEKISVQRLPELLSEEFDGRETKVFAGGGAALYLIDAEEKEAEERLQSIAENVRAESSGGLALIWGSAPLDDDEGNFSDAVMAAHLDLARNRGPLDDRRPPVESGLFQSCASCSKPGAVHRDREGRFICDMCHMKEQSSRAGRYWKDFIRLAGLDEDRAEDYRPDDFERIARFSRRGDYLAAVYMDGDSMGRIVRNLQDRDAYAAFSEGVDACLKEALASAVSEYYRPEGEPEVLPLDVLLLGGDDLVMVTTADAAVPLTCRIIEEFGRLSEGRFGDSGLLPEDHTRLSVSAGIAVFKHKQPFSTVLDQARSLLKSAKRKRRSLESPQPCIDFADVSQSRFMDLEHIRSYELRKANGDLLTMWPMTVEEAQTFHRSVEKLADSPGFSRSRISALVSALLDPSGTEDDVNRIVVHGYVESERPPIMEFFLANGMEGAWENTAGGNRATCILDLATHYSLIAKGS